MFCIEKRNFGISRTTVPDRSPSRQTRSAGVRRPLSVIFLISKNNKKSSATRKVLSKKLYSEYLFIASACLKKKEIHFFPSTVFSPITRHQTRLTPATTRGALFSFPPRRRTLRSAYPPNDSRRFVRTHGKTAYSRHSASLTRDTPHRPLGSHTLLSPSSRVTASHTVRTTSSASPRKCRH